MNNIAIIADGDATIGMGHVVRCMSLAEEIRKLGQRVCFISKTEEGIQRIKDDGFDVFRIAERKEISSFIEKNQTKILIVDSYNVDNEFFSELKSKLEKLVYIDDVNAFDYNVDVVINYNASARKEDYLCCYSAEMLLGTQYALLRKPFQNVCKRDVKGEVQEILITSGSTDHFSTVPFLLKAIINDGYFTEKRINVVIGQGFKNSDLIRDISKGIENVILYENISDLSNLMLLADVAISAGGSTLYELCASGTPTLSYIIAGNQVKSVEALHKQGIIECLGWHNELSSEIVLEKIKALCNDVERRKELSEKMQETVDGKGAQRVARFIVEGTEEVES